MSTYVFEQHTHGPFNVRTHDGTALTHTGVIAPADPPWGIWAEAYSGGQDVQAWLKSYDPDANDGQGEVNFTRDPALAMKFADTGAAMEQWMRVSKVRPTREDGKPNRPLSAFTIEVKRLPA